MNFLSDEVENSTRETNRNALSPMGTQSSPCNVLTMPRSMATSSFHGGRHIKDNASRTPLIFRAFSTPSLISASTTEGGKEGQSDVAFNGSFDRFIASHLHAMTGFTR